MLETNGHFLWAKMVAEQSAIEIVRLQEVINACTHKGEQQSQGWSQDPQVSHFLSDPTYTSLTLHRDALALFANNYHEVGHTTGCILCTIQSENLPARPAPKKHKDFPPVNLWTQKAFRCTCVALTNTEREETDGNMTSVQGKGKHGCPCKGTDPNSKTSHFYLENTDSVPVSEEQITEMSWKAHMLWRMLDSDGMALQTFGQISMRA